MNNNQNNNILSFKEKDQDGIMRFEFLCRGCTMMDRQERWAMYVSSICCDLDEEIDNSYLILEEEPDNKNDPNAIKVIVKGEFFGGVGYVGREYTGKVKEILNGCSSYRLDMKDKKECGNREINLIMSWTK